MKKGSFMVLGLLLFACKKDGQNHGTDFSLLTKFNWQRIEDFRAPFALDPAQIIAYADTSLYSFRDRSFQYNSQATVVSIILGSGNPRFQLRKDNAVIEGQYSVGARDSSLFLSYITKAGGSPGWNGPVRDTMIHTRYKILHLDPDSLKLKTVPDNPTLPFLEKVHTYHAMRK